MILHDVLMLIADCSTLINLTDKNGRTIYYKKKNEFNDEFSVVDVNFIDVYFDIFNDSVALEININKEVVADGK